MKKSFKLYAVCWAVLLALFNVIVFVSPAEAMGLSKFGGSFWSGYLFITLAFVGQLICAYFAFRAESKQKFFYRIPLIAVSYTALILITVAGAVCMAVPGLPNWVGIILCFAILIFSAISVIGAKAAEEVVSGMDEKVSLQTDFMKSLTAEAGAVANRAQDDLLKRQAQKVYEALRYSDPVSREELTELEGQISGKFALFSDAVLTEDGPGAQSAAKALLALLAERNQRCKLLK
ncbi:MAG: hypothetical protein DBY45_08155 [Clostridiales bacterium]|nr:MAG: hypothetical protein DBY45_08155 [Clostridiales bacterium]